MSDARTYQEPEGPYFTGSVTARIPAGQPGGGGGAGVNDLRWSDSHGGIEALMAGEWFLKVPFEAFDA